MVNSPFWVERGGVGEIRVTNGDDDSMGMGGVRGSLKRFLGLN